ncbi:MAG: T9SS type A sorting domain-containing protein [Bacteroidota bacterium]|nr:T9SS type A sorting domain-containing protein [Bacteroidota bacterium]
MSFKQKQSLTQSLRTKLIIAASVSAGLSIIVFTLFFGYFNTAIPEQAKATTTETLSSGSFIINMGVTPQTISNGLRPYGMIYELINTYNVPVKWVIEPTKVKDGADFIHNGITYKGGTFIIPGEFISSTVAARIGYWVSQGVIGNYSVSSISAPVYMEITSFPKVMIDNLSGNDSIIIKYFNNALIPSSAAVINTPTNLSSCHDIWVNPHGDPTWATHSYLYDFVTVEKSFIWMQCHAVSVMENCKNSISPFEQLNYLSTSGLKCYSSGKCGTNPEFHAKALPGAISYFYPTDPVMQFMSTITGPVSGGSERWYHPNATSQWRSTTKRLATTGTSPSPREGVVMVYGPAFGDSTNGLVMYTGGHELYAGSITEQVAAQRSFFNFLLVAGKAKAPIITSVVTGNMNANATDTFSVSATGGQAPYTYSWTSSAGGTFSPANDSVTEFTAFHTMSPWQTVITCVITDACGRRTFFNQVMTVNASALPISLISFNGKQDENKNVLLTWKTASEFNNNYFTISRSLDGSNFTPWRNVSSLGNTNSMQTYTLVDNKPHSGTSYYNLSQTDFDGTKKDLGTIKIQGKSKSLAGKPVTAGPNPFQNRITVTLPEEYQGEASLRLWNVSGRMVHEQKATISGDNNRFTLEALDELPKGTYVLRVFNGSLVSEAIKLIKN